MIILLYKFSKNCKTIHYEVNSIYYRFFLLLWIYFYYTDVQTNKHVKEYLQLCMYVYIYLFILHSFYWMLFFPHTDQILPKFPTPKKMFSRLTLTHWHSVKSQETWILLKHNFVMLNMYRTSVDKALRSS